MCLFVFGFRSLSEAKVILLRTGKMILVPNLIYIEKYKIWNQYDHTCWNFKSYIDFSRSDPCSRLLWFKQVSAFGRQSVGASSQPQGHSMFTKANLYYFTWTDLSRSTSIIYIPCTCFPPFLLSGPSANSSVDSDAGCQSKGCEFEPSSDNILSVVWQTSL